MEGRLEHKKEVVKSWGWCYFVKHEWGPTLSVPIPFFKRFVQVCSPFAFPELAWCPHFINGYCNQGPVSRKSRKLLGPEKPFVKLRPANSVKLIFS